MFPLLLQTIISNQMRPCTEVEGQVHCIYPYLGSGNLSFCVNSFHCSCWKIRQNECKWTCHVPVTSKTDTRQNHKIISERHILLVYKICNTSPICLFTSCRSRTIKVQCDFIHVEIKHRYFQSPQEFVSILQYFQRAAEFPRLQSRCIYLSSCHESRISQHTSALHTRRKLARISPPENENFPER